MSDTKEPLKVFITNRESRCDDCGQELGRKAWICLAGERGALCLTCADLDHLTFLPSGDAALTRRAHKHSTLAAVVLRWSKARERYERQGLLVEESALATAEAECLSDGEARERHRLRSAERRLDIDREYVQRFAARIRELYPNCPTGCEHQVAEHACLKYSGRVGRSAEAKTLSPEMVKLALVAHVRHTKTGYDRLLAGGLDRASARAAVADQIDSLLESWAGR